MKISEYKKLSKKKNKHGNKKVEFDGVVFDSIKELTYYRRFKLDPSIETIEFEPKFILQDKFYDEVNDVKYRAITYKADFKLTYYEGKVEIIEIKGEYLKKEPAYVIRKKLFRKKFPDYFFREI